MLPCPMSPPLPALLHLGLAGPRGWADHPFCVLWGVRCEAAARAYRLEATSMQTPSPDKRISSTVWSAGCGEKPP